MPGKDLFETLMACILLGALIVALIWACQSAVSTYITNQDQMLCRSAIETGNNPEGYCAKAQGFYGVPYNENLLEGGK